MIEPIASGDLETTSIDELDYWFTWDCWRCEKRVGYDTHWYGPVHLKVGSILGCPNCGGLTPIYMTRGLMVPPTEQRDQKSLIQKVVDRVRRKQEKERDREGREP